MIALRRTARLFAILLLGVLALSAQDNATDL